MPSARARWRRVSARQRRLPTLTLRCNFACWPLASAPCAPSPCYKVTPPLTSGVSVSVLDDFRAAEKRVIQRLNELEPAVAEYRELETVAQRLAIELPAATPTTRGTR